MASNVRCTYWRRGHFIGFFEFLKEKNFIRPFTLGEIQHLRESVQTVNCSSCGASIIDPQANLVCPYCHSPIEILDLKQQQQMLAQLKQAAELKPVDARSGDLVQAGLNAVARWLSNLVS